MKRDWNLVRVSLVIMVWFLSSCASTYQDPESFNQKMTRYKPNNLGSNLVPKVSVIANTMTYKKLVAKRSPASSQQENKSAISYISNKRLYFLTLFSQYNHLKRYSQGQTAPEISVCPSFHTSWVTHKEKYGSITNNSFTIKKGIYPAQGVIDDKQLALYPELNLPLSVEAVKPTVADILLNKDNLTDKRNVHDLIQHALHIHIGKTYKELMELCEHSTSNNWYNYDNLLSYIKREGNFKASSHSMGILMKTTLFSNMAIIKSLDLNKGMGKKPSRRIASIGKKDIYTDSVIQRLGVPWAKSYFNEMIDLRHQK